MALRDPRIYPRVGDGIARDFSMASQGMASQGTILREVTRAHGGFVFFRRDNGFVAKHLIVPLAKWRAWASKATVFSCEGVDVEDGAFPVLSSPAKSSPAESRRFQPQEPHGRSHERR